MTQDEIRRAAEAFVREYAMQLPGSFDFHEGIKCFEAGARWMREEAAKVADKLFEMEWNCREAAHEIRQIGEKTS